MNDLQAGLSTEQGLDTLTSMGGSADSLAFSVPADTVPVVSITDFLQPFTEPLYPLVAHLVPPPSSLATGQLPDYTVQGDDTMTLILLGCFVMLVMALKHSWSFIARQAKTFFADSYAHEEIGETSGEMWSMTLLLLINCLLLAIGTFLFTTEDKTATFALDYDILLIGILLLMFIAYYMVKMAAYYCVNNVFFGKKKTLQWRGAFIFLAGVEGALFFPLVLLQVYFNLSFQKVLICFVFVLFLNKILTFYKGWNIFFRGKGGFLQTFLYFCTLEIAPLLACTGLLRMAIEQLKINF